MNEQTNNTHAAFMEVTSKKIEVQDKKIVAIEEKIKSNPDNTEMIHQLIGTIDGLRKDVKASRFPEDKLDDFLTRLDASTRILTQPVQNKVLHQHHVPKLIWITASLFIVLALVCAGWFNTSSKLEGYIANDTKYRQLRLDTGYIKLQLYLDKTDSLYNVFPDIRKSVIEMEDQNRRNFDRLQKAERLKEEANRLENEVKGK